MGGMPSNATARDAKVMCERQDILPVLGKPRQGNGHDVQPVEQIGTEAASLDFLRQIAIGGGDDPHIGGLLAAGAEAAIAAAFQEPQELGLERQRHLADLIEKQRAALRRLDKARTRLCGPGESSALDPEKLRFEQIAGKRGAIHDDERPIGARAGIVNARAP